MPQIGALDLKDCKNLGSHLIREKISCLDLIVIDAGEAWINAKLYEIDKKNKMNKAGYNLDIIVFYAILSVLKFLVSLHFDC